MAHMDWDDLRVALALAEHGTHAAAATALAINPATVGRRMTRLEHDLGGALFSRHQGQWQVTPFGETVLERAAEIGDLTRDIRQLGRQESHPIGAVRITATESLTSHILVPALPKLWAEAPQITVHMQPSAENLTLTRFEADLAIRLARPQEDGTIIRHLGETAFGLYAYKAEQRGPADCPWLTYDDSLADKPEAQWARRYHQDQNVVLRSSDIPTLTAAIANGLGIGVLPRFIGDAHPDLKVLSRDTPIPPRPIWLAYPEGHQHKARMRTTINWIVTTFRNAETMLMGEE